ncbi:MAG: CPBP family glutamic-type intramembrane protease, partial [Thermoguttaceae bacterium]
IAHPFFPRLFHIPARPIRRVRAHGAYHTTGAILAPTLLLAFMLSGSVRQTFVLKFPAWKTIPAAILLAVLLHPSINVLQSAVTQLYPVGEGAKKTLGDLQQMLMGANLWELLLVIAVTPAICEELAFRGFVLSGFRHLGHKWRAIILSAVFFGLTHGILQQSLLACLAGVILGFLAVQTGSIFPCMAFHLTHNTLAVLNSRMTPVFAKNFSWLHTIIIPAKDGGFSYSWTLVFVSALLGMLILWWFGMLTYRKTPEEILSPFVPRK